MYTSSLQFSAKEMVDTNSERIVGIELKSQNYRSLSIFGIYLPTDGLIDNYRQELNVLDDFYPYYINYGNVIVADDLNARCINLNLELINTIRKADFVSVIRLLAFIKLYGKVLSL